MSEGEALDVVREGLMVGAVMAAPILIIALVLGIAVSLLQTITSIQEMTLTFVPKLVAAGIFLAVAGSWMVDRFAGFVIDLWTSIPSLV